MPKKLLIPLLVLFGFCVSVVPEAISTLHASEKSGTLRIGGTGGALGPMQELAQAFRKKHPSVEIVILPSLGSSGGIKAALAGSLDLGLSSRPLNESEKKQGAVAYEYARTPFLFVTSNEKAAGFELTVEKVAAIYRGDLKTWPDGRPLRIVLRPDMDIDTIMLSEMSPEIKRALQAAHARKGIVVSITDTDNADMIEKLPGSFGACSLGQITAEKRSMFQLRFNGTKPDLKNLANGSYPYFKTLYFVTSQNPLLSVKSFMDFVYSPEGRAILSKTGHIARTGSNEGKK